MWLRRTQSPVLSMEKTWAAREYCYLLEGKLWLGDLRGFWAVLKSTIVY